MPESQASVPEKIAAPQKRHRSRIAGWLVLFLCAQVGINVAKHCIRANFEGNTNEMLPAQLQGFPRNQQLEYGHRRAQKPESI